MITGFAGAAAADMAPLCRSPATPSKQGSSLSDFPELGNPVSAGSVVGQKEQGWSVGVLQLKQREGADNCWCSSPYVSVRLHPLAPQQLDWFTRSPVEAK